MKWFRDTNERVSKLHTDVVTIYDKCYQLEKRIVELEKKVKYFDEEKTYLRDGKLADFESVLRLIVTHLKLRIKRVQFPEQFKVAEENEETYHDGW